MYPPDPSATVAVDVEHTYLPGTYDTHWIHSFIRSQHNANYKSSIDLTAASYTRHHNHIHK